MLQQNLSALVDSNNHDTHLLTNDRIHAVTAIQFELSETQSSCYNAGDNALHWMRQISRNNLTPAYVLKQLSSSSDSEVRMAVADHEKTPLEVLEALSEDANPDVRYALAENHNIPRELLRKLTHDSNPYVAQRAHKTLARAPW
jgi:hypothetical protein